MDLKISDHRKWKQHKKKTVAIIVAHPDDETLWAGGTILSHPSWECFIVCLCRGSDKERSSKFGDALKIFKAEGVMGDLNDGPEQVPLPEELIEKTIIDLLPPTHFDLVITHNPAGEYTKHLRHEEISQAVLSLWQSNKILTREIRFFAYEDGNKAYYPRAIQNATIFKTLTKRIWLKKYNLITETYGFHEKSWEAETTPKDEAFWQFTKPFRAKKQLNQPENND